VNNTRLKVLAAESALHYDRRERMCALLADYDPQPDREGVPASGHAGNQRHFPSSLWLITG
jgi:hypothetical protein